MKTAKPPNAEAGPSSSRRAQPVRQTRTNPPRTSSGVARPLNGRDPLGGGHSHDQPIDIFPGISHFTDAITSLPKDLVRHFTLLKEVDAKIFTPEEVLHQLVNAALKSSPPEPRNNNDAASSVAPGSTPMSTQNSSIGIPTNGTLPSGSTGDTYNSTVFDPSNIPRRQLFRQTAFKVQEMLVSIEEKNHVISTANEALSKHLARINDVWPHLEAEFSDEAKWGSTTHWAYPENRANRANQAERSRRDGAATITAAAQQLAEEAAQRSDARKQAIQAKKGLKNHHQDSDHDDHESKQKGESTKKSHNSKARKGADTTAPVGLGITAGATTNGNNPPSKRRKVETNKPANGGQPMERAMSSVFGNNTTKAKNPSPRATPAPEPTKKRKALPTVNGISKKSKTALAAAALSPSTAPSPIQPSFTDSKTISRGSPAPTTGAATAAAAAAAAARPVSARARQNSIQSSIENGRQRPASATSNKPNSVTPATPEISTGQNGTRPPNDTKSSKESITTVKTEASKEEAVHQVASANTPAAGSKKEGSTKAADDPESTSRLDSAQQQAQTTPAASSITTTNVVTTKSGRASKPSTPAIGSFPEHPQAPLPQRSRSSRNNAASSSTSSGATTNVKRSHKKGAAQQQQQQQQQQQVLAASRAAAGDANANANGNGNGSVQGGGGVGAGDDEGGDVEVDADEPLYCYCNGVSYGEMVACDADDCTREWFHLDCVGLKAAPPSSVKWYCDNCKDRIKTGKKVNGR
ncbi:hypothetical protein F5B20DRAFT_320974 [Whalleya microplaca]|nr:hypothetical protein F5B20DRAFT_320974 [Whalleya microplaca]